MCVGSPVLRPVGVILELAVSATPGGDDVLPNGSVQSVELVAEYQTAALPVELAQPAVDERKHSNEQDCDKCRNGPTAHSKTTLAFS